MLLFELIQVNQTKQNIDRHDHYALKQAYLADLRKNGMQNKGAFAKYDQLKDEPKMGEKNTHVPSAEDADAYYTYAKTIADNDLASSNPYFPRVYGIDVVEDKEGNSTNKVKLEHLKPLTSLRKDELMQMLPRMFDKSVIATYNIPPNLVYDGVGMLLRDCLYGKIEAKDENLQEAIEVIKKIMKKYSYNNDINKNNVMIRRTQHGYQLVITDPLS